MNYKFDHIYVCRIPYQSTVFLSSQPKLLQIRIPNTVFFVIRAKVWGYRTLGTRMMSPTTFFPILLGILIIVDRGRGNCAENYLSWKKKKASLLYKLESVRTNST